MKKHILNIESQILQRHITRRGSPEAIEADHVTFRADIAIPALPHSGFDCEPRGDGRWQNFITIVLSLLFEQFDTGH